MSHMAIADLNFVESAFPTAESITGGRGRVTPKVSTAVATDTDTRATTYASIEGDYLSGFSLNVYARGSAAAASASAASIGGQAYAEAYADAG